MINLDNVLKSRDITLPRKVYIVKAMVFPAVMHGCENWTMKKTECWRTDAFELWCWRKLLRVPWTARTSNQSILKDINPEYSLDWCWSWSSNILATWCEEPTHWKRPWCWERRREWQRMIWLDSFIDSVDMSGSKLRKIVTDREARRAAVHGVAKSGTRLTWTTNNN